MQAMTSTATRPRWPSTARRPGGLRLRKLESIGYRCEECVREWQAGLRREEDIELATEVHHIEPLEVNWARRLDITNLKGDCKAHHSAEESHHKRPRGGSKSTGGRRA